jgi:replication factor A1
MQHKIQHSTPVKNKNSAAVIHVQTKWWVFLYRNVPLQELSQRIAASSGRSILEISKLIEEKKNKFSGLLTDSGAAFMIAKELGIDINSDSGTPKQEVKLSNLKEGDNNFDVKVRAMHIFQPKHFEKNGKKGVLCNLVVADETGEMRLTLWHRDAERLGTEKIERGSVILLKNCGMSSYNEKKQLSLNYSGNFIIEKDEAIYPKVNSKTAKLDALAAGMDNVDVYARIARIFPSRDFESSGKKGKLVSFMLQDGTREVRATAWNDSVEEVQKLSQNDVVKIEGAYTKEGLKGEVELHLGWQARILKEPTGVSLPALAYQKSGLSAITKKIGDLQEDDFAEVNVKITGLKDGKMYYEACPKCKKKVSNFGSAYVCEECGEVNEPYLAMIARMDIEDDSGNIPAVAFRDVAEQLLEITNAELKQKVEEGLPDEWINGLKTKAYGKKVFMQGRVKKGLGEELEFMIRSVA